MTRIFRHSQTGRLRVSNILWMAAAVLFASSCVLANWQGNKAPSAGSTSLPVISDPSWTTIPGSVEETPHSATPRPNPSRELPLQSQTAPKPSVATTRKQVSPYVPAMLVMERLKLSLPVLAMPLEYENGVAKFPVPPNNIKGINPRWTTAWWRDGAKPGSGQGVVHFDVHTYKLSNAAGNVLGSSGARLGDIIKLQDKTRAVRSCYRVTEVSLFKPNQLPERLWRKTGPAGLAIEFCWDTPDNWGQWLHRKYVVATEVACA